jgi:hypothetical protein
VSQRRFVPKVHYDLPCLPFATPEEAWFWFVRCQTVRREGARFAEAVSDVRRPCDPDDVYRIVVGLSRQGTLRKLHLGVLGRFGLAGRPPDARCPEESAAARLWSEAFDRLATVFRDKGIVL